MTVFFSNFAETSMSSDDHIRAVLNELQNGIPSDRSGSTQKRGRLVRTGIPALDGHTNTQIFGGSIVEVIGASMSGKTQLLQSIAAFSIANTTAQRANVCWYDLNGRVDVDLIQKMSTKYRAQSGIKTASGGGVRVYHVQSTTELCTSLDALMSFTNERDGECIDTVVIDGVGAFRYIDRHLIESARRDGCVFQLGSGELLFARKLRELVERCELTVFASKCAVAGEEKLDVSWPFKNAAVPNTTTEFMPEYWSNCIACSLLVYEVSEGDHGTRAMVVLRGGKRKKVIAGGAFVITSQGVVHSKNAHLV